MHNCVDLLYFITKRRCLVRQHPLSPLSFFARIPAENKSHHTTLSLYFALPTDLIGYFFWKPSPHLSSFIFLPTELSIKMPETIVIDGRDHLLGRLASVVAKELLAGKKIVIVRCDEVCVSGSLVRNKVKYAYFRKLRHNTNPSRGPFHFKSPARMVWRTIRGMVSLYFVENDSCYSFRVFF